MYCITVFFLIEYSLKQDSIEYLRLANITALPYMKQNDANKLIKELQSLGEPEQKITKDTIQKDRERLRKILAGGGVI